MCLSLEKSMLLLVLRIVSSFVNSSFAVISSLLSIKSSLTVESCSGDTLENFSLMSLSVDESKLCSSPSSLSFYSRLSD